MAIAVFGVDPVYVVVPTNQGHLFHGDVVGANL